jgi:hypothetical protein
VSTDPALDLVVAYLGLNGYFVLTDQELHVREPTGFRSLTDIDIIAVRPPSDPGPPHHHTGDGVEECLIVTDCDPDLEIDPDRFDVILGEVKTGEATFNPALLTAGALHAPLRRTGNIYSATVNQVVDHLLIDGEATTASARIRLVGFGSHGRIPRGATIHLGSAARFIRGHLKRHQNLYRVTRFSDPVLALLGLLDKVTVT